MHVVSMCYVLQIFRVDALGSTNLLFNVLQFLTFYLFLFNILQFTRDALIVLAGSKEKGRDFVYFTEVKDIPSTDLATIERLWNKFSRGKFGYSVQKVSNYVWCYVYFPFDLSTYKLTQTSHTIHIRKSTDRAKKILKYSVKRLDG